ncbi:MAG: hypothetical protein U9O18_00310 [Chloroflexota bacterium]|nr:hypothetical protein [Chloroflexota bacterium]
MKTFLTSTITLALVAGLVAGVAGQEDTDPAIEATRFSGTGSAAEIIAAPTVTTTPDGVTQIRELIGERVLTADDPRFSGTETFHHNEDRYGEVVGPVWGTSRLQNQGGSWTGSYRGVVLADGSARQISSYVGEDGYAGLGATCTSTSDSGGAFTRDCVLFPGALPTASEPDATVVLDRIPVLTAIRTAHHQGFDRIVFDFAGPLPEMAEVQWANDLRLDPSDRAAHVHGNAFLQVRFSPAITHDESPPQDSTFGPQRRAYGLPNISHLVLLGAVEGDVSFGIGLMKKTKIIRATTLRRPSRFVIDVATRFPKAEVGIRFVDEPAVIAGRLPEVVSVRRKVPRGRKPESVLHRLYAGPTEREARAGLRFIDSGTTGFGDLRIDRRGVARVTLRGRCDSRGSTMTVANQIIPTLRQLGRIDWVKIYDRNGETLYPRGKTDSLPGCLQP